MFWILNVNSNYAQNGVNGLTGCALALPEALELLLTNHSKKKKKKPFNEIKKNY